MLIKWFFVGSFSFLRCRQHWLLLECNLSYNLQRRFVGLHDLAACHRLPKQEAKTHVAQARLGIVTADDLCCLFLCNRFFFFSGMIPPQVTTQAISFLVYFVFSAGRLLAVSITSQCR